MHFQKDFNERLSIDLRPMKKSPQSRNKYKDDSKRGPMNKSTGINMPQIFEDKRKYNMTGKLISDLQKEMTR